MCSVVFQRRLWWFPQGIDSALCFHRIYRFLWRWRFRCKKLPHLGTTDVLVFLVGSLIRKLFRSLERWIVFELLCSTTCTTTSRRSGSLSLLLLLTRRSPLTHRRRRSSPTHRRRRSSPTHRRRRRRSHSALTRRRRWGAHRRRRGRSRSSVTHRRRWMRRRSALITRRRRRRRRIIRPFCIMLLYRYLLH